MGKWCREIYLFPPVELSSIEAAAQRLRDMLIADGAEKESMNIFATAGPNNTLRLVGFAKIDKQEEVEGHGV